MTIKVGEKLPEGFKFVYVPWAPEKESLIACGIPVPFDPIKEFANKKVVIVSVPGAFTPTCTENHIPPYIADADKFWAKGVDKIIVISANDPFVQAAWGKANNVTGSLAEKIIFASDFNAEFSKHAGLTTDLTSKGLGLRTSRYALILDHDVVKYVGVEPGPGVTVSGAPAVLAKL